MQLIVRVEIGSTLDFDHGEGWVTFSWSDSNGIDRALTIDFDGHCSREMPVRSGTGVTITSVQRNQVCLRFTHELAARLKSRFRASYTQLEFQPPRGDSLSLHPIRINIPQLE